MPVKTMTADELRDRHAAGERDFRGVEVAGGNLARAVLADADFRGARFQRCDLARADFRGARLDEAVLEEVDLHGTDFRNASLQGAVASALPHIVGRGPDLDGARVDGADFRGDIFFWASRDCDGLAAWDPPPDWEWGVPIHTPWGGVNNTETLAAGVTFISAVRHGGIWVAPARRKELPPELQERGWYEQHVDYRDAVAVFASEIRDRLEKDGRETPFDWPAVQLQAERRGIPWDHVEQKALERFAEEPGADLPEPTPG